MILTSPRVYRVVGQGSPALAVIANGTSTAWPLAASPQNTNSGLALLIINNGNGDVMFRLGSDATIVVGPNHAGTHRVAAGKAIVLDEAEISASTATYVAVMSSNSGSTKITFYRAYTNKMVLFDDPSLSFDITDALNSVGGFFIPVNSGTPSQE